MDQSEYNSEFHSAHGLGGGGGGFQRRSHAGEDILKTNRFIKKEVIDVADLVEKVSRVLIIQNQKIDYLTAFVQNQ